MQQYQIERTTEPFDRTFDGSQRLIEQQMLEDLGANPNRRKPRMRGFEGAHRGEYGRLVLVQMRGVDAAYSGFERARHQACGSLAADSIGSESEHSANGFARVRLSRGRKSVFQR